MSKSLIRAINSGKTNEMLKVLDDAFASGGKAAQQQLLLERNKLGESPLICAIKKKYMTVAKVIIDIDPDLDYQVPKTGNTAMMYAAEIGHEAIISKLILFRADVNIKNLQGKTASDIAIDSNHPEAAPKNIIPIQQLVENIQDLNINRSEENKQKAYKEEKAINKNPVAYINPALIEGTIGSSDLLVPPIAPYNNDVSLSGDTNTDAENVDS